MPDQAAEPVKVPAPRNAAQAAETLRRIGEVERAVSSIEERLNTKIGRLTKTARGLAEPLKAELARLDEVLEAWAGKNRETLLEPGKKSFSLATGELGWKADRPKAELTKDEKDVIAAIEKRGETLKKLFLRVGKITVDRQALLKHADDAAKIPGVMIVTGGETFFRKPIAAEIQKAA
jgi:phage host-nuclease inhibitor protein Gam